MKILQVISSFPPAYDYGGPPRSAYNLSKALVERGHEVTVFTTDALDATQRFDIESNPTIRDGISIYRFKNISNRLSWENYPLAPRMLTALARHGAEYDIIHSHEYRSFHTTFAHIASQLYDVPHVLQPRGSMPRFEGSLIKAGFDKIIGKSIVHDASAVIASSKVESAQFDSVVPDLNPNQIAHIPNGVSLDQYLELPAKGSFRNQYDIDETTDIVLFLSRLHPRKGGDLLLKATAESLSDDRLLVFAGPDEGHRDELQQLARDEGVEDHVFFTGPLYDDEKLAAYLDADVFVLPSKNQYESFGNVVVEAMACGTPAVYTDVCGVAEWINHGGCRMAKPEPDALANEMESILQESGDKETLQDYVHEHFSWDAIAEKTENIYRELKR